MGIHSPKWFPHETGSGTILLPFEPAQMNRQWLHLGHDREDGGILARFSGAPTFLDQTGSLLDERQLGLTPLGVQGAIELSSRLSFEKQARMIAVLQEAFAMHGASVDFQLSLAQTLVMGEELRRQISSELQGFEPRAMISDQTLYALSRVVVTAAGGGDPSTTSSPDEEAAATRLILAGTGLTMNAEELTTGDAGDFNLVEVLLQMSGLSASEPFPTALGRASRMFRELPTSPEGKANEDFCDFGSWQDDSGVTVDDQFALGISLFLQLLEARTKSDAYLSPMTWSLEGIKELSNQYSIDPDWLIENASADREWLKSRFETIESLHGLDESMAYRGWNRIPFDERPFLRLEDEVMILWSPQSLLNWITEGLFFRIRELAPSANDAIKFGQFYAWLFEEHCRRLVEETLGTSDLPGTGRVVAPFKYARDQNETPDLILDFGTDLVVVEVCSGRLNLSTRLRGEADDVETNLDNILISKAVQLSRRIGDYLENRFEIPEIDRKSVKRIWPVLVVGGPLMMNEIIGETIEQRLAGSFSEDGVQKLNILTPGDLDLAMSLVESGTSLLKLLETRVGGHQWLGFNRFVSDSPFLPDVGQSSSSRRTGEAVLRMVAERGGLEVPPEQQS